MREYFSLAAMIIAAVLVTFGPFIIAGVYGGSDEFVCALFIGEACS